MAQRTQHIRHSATQADAFAGLEGEITVDLTNKEFRLHDGQKSGGFATARKDLQNVSAATNASDGKMSAAKIAELEAATAKDIVQDTSISNNATAISNEVVARTALEDQVNGVAGSITGAATTVITAGSLAYPAGEAFQAEFHLISSGTAGTMVFECNGDTTAANYRYSALIDGVSALGQGSPAGLLTAGGQTFGKITVSPSVTTNEALIIMEFCVYSGASSDVAVRNQVIKYDQTAAITSLRFRDSGGVVSIGIGSTWRSRLL